MARIAALIKTSDKRCKVVSHFVNILLNSLTRAILSPHKAATVKSW